MSSNNTQALILAAGRGSRLKSAIGEYPKCLTKIAGKSLIEHQLDSLEACGIDRVTIVVGHFANDVRMVIGERALFVENSDYMNTNSLYSLRLALDWVELPLVVMNCDVLAHCNIVEQVVHSHGNAFAFDSSSGMAAEHMKISLSGGRLVAMSKELPSKHTHGENVGIVRFGRNILRPLLEISDSLLRADGRMKWMASAVNLLAQEALIVGIDIRGLPWIEIDYPEDLATARNIVWPIIKAASDDAHSSRNRPSRLGPNLGELVTTKPALGATGDLKKCLRVR